MSITVTGLHDGILKEVVVKQTPSLTIESIICIVSDELRVPGCLLLIRQGCFYFESRENIKELLSIDSSPLSFEIGAEPIPITLKYGCRVIKLLVDAKCRIEDIKLRCQRILSSYHKSINVTYVIYNEVVCNESSTLSDCEITPFSTLYLCSDLYELHVCLPDSTTISLYKPYYTLFPSLLEELAKHSKLDSLMLSVYLIESPESRKYITSSTEQLYKLFDDSTVSLQVTQASLSDLVTLLSRMENQPKSSSEADESRIINSAQTIEESVQSIQKSVKQTQQDYVDQLSILVEEVNSLNQEMEEVMRCVGEIDLIRREQADIERQCDLLDSMSVVTPAIWDLSNRLEALEASAKGVVGGSGEESSARRASEPLEVRSPPPIPPPSSSLKPVTALPRGLKKSPPPPPIPSQFNANRSNSMNEPASRPPSIPLPKSSDASLSRSGVASISKSLPAPLSKSSASPRLSTTSPPPPPPNHSRTPPPPPPFQSKLPPFSCSASAGNAPASKDKVSSAPSSTTKAPPPFQSRVLPSSAAAATKPLSTSKPPPTFQSKTLPTSSSSTTSLTSDTKTPPPLPNSQPSKPIPPTPFSSRSLDHPIQPSKPAPPSIPKSRPPIPLSTPSRRSSSPMPPSRPPPLSAPAKATNGPSLTKNSSETSSVPLRRVLPMEESQKRKDASEASEAGEAEGNGIVLMKPSQLRNNPLFNKLNFAPGNPRKPPVIKKTQDDEVMPDLHRSFAPPPRPKNFK